MKNIIITIDGPAASGKGRIAKYISKKWKLKHLDTGILYRKLAIKVLENNFNFKSSSELKKIINNTTNLSFRKNKSLRAEIVSKTASKVAVYKFVRNFVNKVQTDYVSKNIKRTGFVIDGRDIGSVVFKDADLKLYIETNEKNRAKRRYKQLIDAGEKSIYPQILKELKLRDKKDIKRKNSPLVIPTGAKLINNNQSFQHTTNQINNLIEEITK